MNLFKSRKQRLIQKEMLDLQSEELFQGYYDIAHGMKMK